MNKQLADAQRRVERVTARLEKELGLSAWWEIKHKFSEGHDGDGTPQVNGMPQVNVTTACTSARWQYRKADIIWYLPSVAIVDDDYLEWVAVHEYVHMLNAPMAEFLLDYLKDDEPALEQLRALGHYSKLEEFVTESVARIIQKARGKDVPG